MYVSREKQRKIGTLTVVLGFFKNYERKKSSKILGQNPPTVKQFNNQIYIGDNTQYKGT